MTQNLAADLLNKYIDKQIKEKKELETDKNEFLTELIRVETELKKIEDNIALCNKEITRVSAVTYNTISNDTGIKNTNIYGTLSSICPKP